MIRTLLLFSVFAGLGHFIKIGPGLSKTNSILETVHEEYMNNNGGRSTPERCYRPSNEAVEPAEEAPEENSFLDMANFLEYVQLTEIKENSREEALKFYKVSTAAFQAGNNLVAQESFGRAVAALENYHSRRRREAAGFMDEEIEEDEFDSDEYSSVMKRSVKRNAQGSESNAIYDPSDLFRKFRLDLGERNFNKLFHLKRSVTMAFVIDTSGSMENDMEHVKSYIRSLLVEQARSGVPATYVVTPFAEDVGASQVFDNSQELMEYLDKLKTRVGGDCAEKVCFGMLRAMYNSHFMRKGNAAMFVFTDASSKDCSRLSPNIIRSFQFCKASAFFILFDSCVGAIDPHMAKIGQRTNGFCLLVRKKAVYNITDTVNGMFGVSNMVVGEDSMESAAFIGQGLGPYVRLDMTDADGSGRRGRGRRSLEEGQSSEKKILIDELIGSFKVSVSIEPPHLVEDVKLRMPMDGDESLCVDSNNDIVRSVADNGVVFNVEAKTCPCVGNWSITYPSEATHFIYTVTSVGSFSLSFDAYFVDDASGTQNANYAPCLGIEEYLMIKLNQGAQVLPETLKVNIVGLAGNMVHMSLHPRPLQGSKNTYIVRLRLPQDLGTGGFRVVLEGEVSHGSRFKRVSSTIFNPTSACFRIGRVRNYHALFPATKTIMNFDLSNNSPSDEVFTVVCSNSENYEIEVGDPRVRHPSRPSKLIRSNPILLSAGSTAQYYVVVNAPRTLKHGRTVIVTCTASSNSEEMIEFVRLTEMSERFYN